MSWRWLLLRKCSMHSWHLQTITSSSSASEMPRRSSLHAQSNVIAVQRQQGAAHSFHSLVTYSQLRASSFVSVQFISRRAAVFKCKDTLNKATLCGISPVHSILLISMYVFAVPWVLSIRKTVSSPMLFLFAVRWSVLSASADGLQFTRYHSWSWVLRGGSDEGADSSPIHR